MDRQFLQGMMTNKTIICFAESIYRTNGVWEGPNPLNPVVPLYIIQLTIIIILTQLLVLPLKYFNQPPFVAQLLAGILLGPTLAGRIQISKLVFSNYGFYVLEPMAHLALVIYAFLVGLDTDVAALKRTGTKATNIAISGALVPFIMGVCLFFCFQSPNKLGCLYWGSALTATGFSVLTKHVEKQKILHTEVGKTAMASALLTDSASWAFLAISIASTSNDYTAQWAVICTCVLIIFTIYVLRPAIAWIIRRVPGGQGYSEFYLCFVLCGAWLWGILADVCGTHPMIGAFAFGVIMQNQELEVALLEKLEDFTFEFLMPGFFLVCGLRTNIDVISDNGTNWAIVLLVLILLCAAKILSSVVAYHVYKLPFEEGLPVGILSNTKSIMALIIVEIGQQQGALTTQTYSLMVIAILVMSMLVSPLMMYNQPSKNMAPYTRKTIQKARQDEELRIMACIHGLRNVPSFLSLLEASNASQRSPIRVFALQLVELVGRASAMLVVHDARKSGPRNPTQEETQTEQIVTAFDNLELRTNFLTAKALTVRSSYSTMDQDISSLAWENRAAFIILPFHKQHTIDGEMEESNPAMQSINESVLANAPCSVGILIDRGFAESHDFTRHVAMLYFGGPDDREALAYAWRMAENPDIKLAVVRFIPGKEAIEMDSDIFNTTESSVTINVDVQREKLLDDEYLNKFKIATANDQTISYRELTLGNEEEMVRAIKSLDTECHHLYIVGRGRGMVSPLTAGLADWCECPELGPIGDILVTSEFASSFSVLAVQQYLRTPDYSQDLEGSQLLASENRISSASRTGFSSFNMHGREGLDIH